MVYVWIQNSNGGVLLVRLLNGNLGLPFGARLHNEPPMQTAIRIAECKTGVVISNPVDTYDGILFSDIDIDQSPSVEGVVVVSMFALDKRTDIDPRHRELMGLSFMI